MKFLYYIIKAYVWLLYLPIMRKWLLCKRNVVNFGLSNLLLRLLDMRIGHYLKIPVARKENVIYRIEFKIG